MGTGQTMLTMLAMVLMSFLLLRVNSLFLQTNTTLFTTKFEVLAFSLGQSMIQEIESEAFDQATVSAVVSSTASLSTVLGPETGETYATFNDIDDFNNYTRTVTNLPSAVFNIKCKVEYVNSATPDVVTTTPTWNKRITVFVTSPSMMTNAKDVTKADTVKVSQVFSYWIFK
jgi:hypothetical protein